MPSPKFGDSSRPAAGGAVCGRGFRSAADESDGCCGSSGYGQPGRSVTPPSGIRSTRFIRTFCTARRSTSRTKCGPLTSPILRCDRDYLAAIIDWATLRAGERLHGSDLNADRATLHTSRCCTFGRINGGRTNVGNGLGGSPRCSTKPSIHATATDHRIKAVATISAVDMGRQFRNGGDGKQDPVIIQGMLGAAAAARTAEARGEGVGVFRSSRPPRSRRAPAASTSLRVGSTTAPTARSIPSVPSSSLGTAWTALRTSTRSGSPT
jgi:hypothetical protein